MDVAIHRPTFHLKLQPDLLHLLSLADHLASIVLQGPQNQLNLVPTFIMPWHTIYFSEGSCYHLLDEDSLRLLAWTDSLSTHNSDSETTLCPSDDYFMIIDWGKRIQSAQNKRLIHAMSLLQPLPPFAVNLIICGNHRVYLVTLTSCHCVFFVRSTFSQGRCRDVRSL